MSYEREGVEPAGDADKGECGIRIKDIDFKHIGEWRCVLIRQSLSGLGSEIAEKRITLVAESSRLRKEDLNEPRLLGFKRNVFSLLPHPQRNLKEMPEISFIFLQARQGCPIDFERNNDTHRGQE